MFALLLLQRLNLLQRISFLSFHTNFVITTLLTTYRGEQWSPRYIVLMQNYEKGFFISKRHRTLKSEYKPQRQS